MSDTNNIDQYPDHLKSTSSSTVYDNNFFWDMFKSSLFGALLGPVAMIVNSSLKNKGKPINHYIYQLKYETVNMEEQYELCKLFYELQEEYSKHNPKEFENALKRCNDLCLLYQNLVENETFHDLDTSMNSKNYGQKKNELIRKLNEKEKIALNLWGEMSEHLQSLIISIRLSEKALFRQKQNLYDRYQMEMERYKKAKMQWDVLEFEAKKIDIKEMDKFTFDGSMTSMLQINDHETSKSQTSKLPPKPIQPIHPSELTIDLKSDKAKNHTDVIVYKCLQMYNYISHHVQKKINQITNKYIPPNKK